MRLGSFEQLGDLVLKLFETGVQLLGLLVVGRLAGLKLFARCLVLGEERRNG